MIRRAARSSAWLNAGGAFFGRRKGHRLRAQQSALLETLLPRLALDLSAPAPSDLRTLFPKPAAAEVRLEIGFGGGEHLLAEAEAHRDLGHIGCEPFVNGMAKALAGIAARELQNIRLHFGDAADLLAWLPAGALGRIDLLYPDPWPKRRHWKRRFIQASGWRSSRACCGPGGTFRFATDWADYAAWTLALVQNSPDFTWTAERADDWRRPWPGYAATRYEAKARREGRASCYLTFRKLREADQPLGRLRVGARAPEAQDAVRGRSRQAIELLSRSFHRGTAGLVAQRQHGHGRASQPTLAQDEDRVRLAAVDQPVDRLDRDAAQRREHRHRELERAGLGGHPAASSSVPARCKAATCCCAAVKSRRAGPPTSSATRASTRLISACRSARRPPSGAAAPTVACATAGGTAAAECRDARPRTRPACRPAGPPHQRRIAGLRQLGSGIAGEAQHDVAVAAAHQHVGDRRLDLIAPGDRQQMRLALGRAIATSASSSSRGDCSSTGPATAMSSFSASWRTTPRGALATGASAARAAAAPAARSPGSAARIHCRTARPAPREAAPCRNSRVIRSSVSVRRSAEPRAIAS